MTKPDAAYPNAASAETGEREAIADIIDALVSGPNLSNIEGGKAAHRLDQLAAADRILALTTAGHDVRALREALSEAVEVLERLPYGDWPGKWYSGKSVAANSLMRRARSALAQAEGKA